MTKTYTHPINRKVVVVQIDDRLVCGQLKADKYNSDDLKPFTMYAIDGKRIRINDGCQVRLMSELMTRRSANFLLKKVSEILANGGSLLAVWAVRENVWC